MFTESKGKGSPLPPGTVTRRRKVSHFELPHNGTHEKLDIVIQPTHTGYAQLLITNHHGVVGLLQGTIVLESDGKTAFQTYASHNLSSRHGLIPHVRGAVSATITHLLTSKLIDRWYSDVDENLSNDARKMYGKNLAGDPRLSVTPPSGTVNRYVITTKE